MSENESTSNGSSGGQPQNSGREVARRVFARELDDATFTFKESDDDRAPLYALLPTGEKANRLFIVGTLTEVNDVGDDSEYLQARIVGPSGTFFAYAGQYQPEAAAFLRQADTPSYVAVTAKPRTYETDDGINVSLRPESITEVDVTTRNKWVAETADQTLDRIDADDPSNEYNQLVAEHYGEVDLTSYKETAVEAIHSMQGNDIEGDETSDQPEAEASTGAGGA